jgi:hypothetical protein
MKRKAKEQLVGHMDDLQTALASLENDIVPPESMDKPSSPSTPSEVENGCCTFFLSLSTLE